jgi:hypothetical protein
VVRIVFLNNRDEAARAGRVDPFESRVVLDHIHAAWERKRLDRAVCVKIERGQQVIGFTREECPMVLRIESHSVVITTSALAKN